MVIERILCFPVSSPVMKILTGLEVLLRKAQVRQKASGERERVCSMDYSTFALRTIGETICFNR